MTSPALDAILYEGMTQRLVDGDALVGVEHEHLVEQVAQLRDLAQLVVGQALRADHLGQDVLARVDDAHHCDLLLQSTSKHTRRACA